MKRKNVLRCMSMKPLTTDLVHFLNYEILLGLIPPTLLVGVLVLCHHTNFTCQIIINARVIYTINKKALKVSARADISPTLTTRSPSCCLVSTAAIQQQKVPTQHARHLVTKAAVMFTLAETLRVFY